MAPLFLGFLKSRVHGERIASLSFCLVVQLTFGVQLDANLANHAGNQRLDLHLQEGTTIVGTDLDRGCSSTVPRIVAQASDVVEEIPDAFLH